MLENAYFVKKDFLWFKWRNLAHVKSVQLKKLYAMEDLILGPNQDIGEGTMLQKYLFSVWILKHVLVWLVLISTLLVIATVDIMVFYVLIAKKAILRTLTTHVNYVPIMEWIQ